MAIGTDSAIDFFGTQDTLGTSSAAVTNGSFSIASDLSTWVNDDDAKFASIVLLADWNTTAPDVNSSIKLYARLLNIQSTNDQDVPDANFQHVFMGRFPVNDVLTNQYIPIIISLPNNETSQNYEFYINNLTGQTIQAGWDIFITPKAIGPHG